jgi:2'-5' RNA ligase
MKAYVYAPLPENVHRFFPKERGGDDESVPHCTVLFIGEIDKSNVSKLKEILVQETQGHAPIQCRFGELKSFPAGEYGVPWYVEIEADPSLSALHETIWDKLKEADIPVEHRFKNYVPHATLKYLPEGEKYSADLPTGEFVINALELDLN